MKKLSPNRAQLFLRNKYTVFSMGGTVALRSVNKNISGELSTVLQLLLECLVYFLFVHNAINSPRDATPIIYGLRVQTLHWRWGTNKKLHHDTCTGNKMAPINRHRYNLQT